MTGDAGLQGIRHSGLTVQVGRRPNQSDGRLNELGVPGQTRDFGVDRLKQQKTAPGWGNSGP
jgi:hypothetical protein